MRNILCNVRRPIPILVAEVWRRKLDYAKNLQAKYLTSKKYPDLWYTGFGVHHWDSETKNGMTATSD